MRARSVVSVSLVLSTLVVTGLHAQDARTTFHEAYFREKELNDLEAAITLYEEVLADAAAPDDLAARARARLAVCRERVRASDLTALVPEDLLAYAELRSPGEGLGKLAADLGLTRAPGAGADPDAERAAGGGSLLSPRLLEAFAGIDGIAVAITDFDPRGGPPSGVVIVNAAGNDLVQGIVETSLTSAIASGVILPGEPVRGHPSYVSPFGTIVVTGSLVVAGNPPELAADVIRRLEERADSDTAPEPRGPFAELARVRAESMLFAFVDGKRILDRAKREMARHGGTPDEYRMLQAFTDVESLRWAAASLSPAPSGISGKLLLSLDEDNHALAYHLLRTPPLRTEILNTVPRDAVALAAMALCGPDAVGDDARARTARQITGLDIGREIFGNIRDLVLFLVPPDSGARAGATAGLPGAGLVFSVRDPARSAALWSELLSLGATLAQGDPAPVRSLQIDGREVTEYVFPESIHIYTAATGDRFVLGSTPAVIAQALAAGDATGSIRQDPAFGAVIESLPETVNKLLIVHARRAVELAGAAGALRRSEVEQARAILGDETVVLTTSETPASFGAALLLGLPRIDGFLREGIFGRARGPREDRGIRLGSRARDGRIVLERESAAASSAAAAAPAERD